MNTYGVIGGCDSCGGTCGGTILGGGPQKFNDFSKMIRAQNPNKKLTSKQIGALYNQQNKPQFVQPSELHVPASNNDPNYKSATEIINTHMNSPNQYISAADVLLEEDISKPSMREITLYTEPRQNIYDPINIYEQIRTQIIEKLINSNQVPADQINNIIISHAKKSLFNMSKELTDEIKENVVEYPVVGLNINSLIDALLGDLNLEQLSSLYMYTNSLSETIKSNENNSQSSIPAVIQEIQRSPNDVEIPVLSSSELKSRRGPVYKSQTDIELASENKKIFNSEIKKIVKILKNQLCPLIRKDMLPNVNYKQRKRFNTLVNAATILLMDVVYAQEQLSSYRETVRKIPQYQRKKNNLI